MAISGTYDPADARTVILADVGVDIGATASFAAIESWATKASITGGTTATSTIQTLDGTKTTITGPSGEFTAVIEGIFTQGTTDPYKNLADIHTSPTADKSVDVKISEPAVTGSLIHTLTGGSITDMTYFSFDSTTTGLVMFSFTVTAPTLTITVSA